MSKKHFDTGIEKINRIIGTRAGMAKAAIRKNAKEALERRLKEMDESYGKKMSQG